MNTTFGRRHWPAILAAAIGVATPAGAGLLAQDNPPQRPTPCLEREEFGQFDFWVGDWDVYDAKGTLVGTNHVYRAADGCVLVEEWKSLGGGSGVSVNYFDAARSEWVQVWNGSGGTQLTIRGGLTEDGSMRLVGGLHYVGNGKDVSFRGLWTPLDDGRVRQYFEQSADDGETWQPWFEGFYTRQVTEARDPAGREYAAGAGQ